MIRHSIGALMLLLVIWVDYRTWLVMGWNEVRSGLNVHWSQLNGGDYVALLGLLFLNLVAISLMAKPSR
jgi:hypothetical protein